MKISNSKKELARIISENDGWIAGGFAAQQDDGEIWFSATKPIWKNRCGTFDMGDEGHFTIGHLIANRHQTILSRDEYFHLYPLPDADGWIEWKGGDQPVKGGIKVDVKYKTSGTNIGVRAGFTGRLNEGSMSGYGAATWSHTGSRSDIIAYRLHKPEQSGATDKLSSEAVSAAKIALMSDSIEELARKPEQANPEFCESVMRSIPEPIAKPTIEQLAADYHSAKDYADRKQQEADAAKADAEVRLKALVLAGEAIGLIVSPITAKQEPELVITDWRDLQVGDVIELTGSANPCWKEHSASEMTVKEVYRDQGDGDDQVDLLGESGCWSLGGNTTWRFIRRP